MKSNNSEKVINNLEARNKELYYENILLKIQVRINRLIKLEEDSSELIKNSCALIESSSIFRLSFGLLKDGKNNYEVIHCDNQESEFFSVLEEIFKRGGVPKCLSETLSNGKGFIIPKDSKFCTDCNLTEYNENYQVKLSTLKYQQNFYGVLYTFIKKNTHNLNKVSEKLDEISKELAYGIYSINLEKKTKKTNKDLQKSEKKYRLLSNNARDLIYAHDLEGNFIYLNKAMENFLTLKKEEIIGKNVLKFVPKRDRSPLLRRSEIRDKGDMSHLIYEIEAKLPDGKKIPLEVNSVPIIEDGEIIGIHCVARNITERKKTEKALRKSKKKYQKAFNRAEFYKDLLAHDIRNILQGILTGLQLIEFHLKRNTDQSETIENLGIVKDQIDRGLRLVLNIKKLSKITHEEMGLKSMEILPILEQCVENIKRVFTKRPLSIEINCKKKDLKIKANELLEDLFENLMINSIKHNNNQKIQITINIFEIEHDEHKFVRFEFIDNGMGIQDSRKEQLFERAYYNRKNLKILGLGLGLSLVKRIIDLYKGDIWVENRVKEDYSKGSKFIIEIPKYKNNLRK